jgi:hypothetical protein
MPYLIECLTYVDESSWAVAFAFQVVVDFISILCARSMVLCSFLFPNWWESINLLSSILGVSRWRSIISRIFDKIGRRLIGRYDVIWVLSWFYNHYDLSHFPLTKEIFGLKYGIINLCYCSETFLRKFFKNFSGYQVVARRLFLD